MDTTIIILLYGFLLAYSVSVATRLFDRMYWICYNDYERQMNEKEKDKNKEIPNECKHMYS